MFLLLNICLFFYLYLRFLIFVIKTNGDMNHLKSMEVVFRKGLEVSPSSFRVSLWTESKTGHRRNRSKEHVQELYSQSS